jgi:putative flippase GtrA
VRSLLRFSIVGLGMTALHVGVASLLITRAQWHPAAANSLAFVLANLCSFAANSLWSFNSRPQADNLMRFFAVSVLAWAVTTGLAAAVEGAGGPFWLGIALVVTVVPALSYLAHRHFSFRGSVRDP